MKPIAFLALTVVGLLCAVMVFAVVGQAFEAFREPTYAELVADQVQAETLQRQAELDAIWAPRRAAFLAFVVVVCTTGAIAYVGGLAAAHVRRAHLERLPNAQGLLPVYVADQETARAALAAFHQTQAIAAGVAPVPQTYSPHIVYSPHHALELEYKPTGMQLPGDVAPSLPQLATVPAFSELLQSGRVGRGNPLLLGFDRETGAELPGSWLDLYSCAVGGLAGSGKSWTATYLLAQATLFGSRLLILDPHAESEESLAARLSPLSSRFLCEPASTPREMLEAVKLAQEELRRRKEEAYVRGSAPIIVVADEFSALQRGELAEPLAELVEALAQEGRKLDLFGMVCGQVWTGSRTGGTELRDSLASAYVHRLRPAQARVLTGYAAADLPGDLLELPPGTCYMLSTAGDLRPVVIPRMTPADVARVAELLGASPAAPAPQAPASEPTSQRRPVGFRPRSAEVAAEVGGEVGPASPLRGHQDAAQHAWTPEEARIVALLAQGKGPREIVKELYQVTGGDAYTAASAKVRAVLARLAALAQMNGGGLHA